MAYEQFTSQLAGIVGRENVLTSEEDRNVYSYDGTSTWIHKPDLVVFPTETSHVAAVLKLANENRIPVTPRGGGTNVSGGSVPIRGGIVLVMTKMNRILSIDAANLSARVQAGVVLMDLQTALAQERLFFPPDPQSFLGATLGGIIAENAGGPVCLKYGVTKQYLLGIQAVLPTGRTVEFGGNTVKNVVGYDLVSLVTGSEGTLAVVTEAVLRLLPLPSARKTIVALFDDLPKSGATVGKILDAGTIPAKIELLDNWVVRSINRITGMGLPEDAAAMLMFECDGKEEVVEHDSQKVIDVCRGSRCHPGLRGQGSGAGADLLEGPQCGFRGRVRRRSHGAGRRRDRTSQSHGRIHRADRGDLQKGRSAGDGHRPCGGRQPPPQRADRCEGSGPLPKSAAGR